MSSPGGARWTFGDDGAPTVVSATAHELCLVAGQRTEVSATPLAATGPDAEAVLALVRTFA